jgi:tetratricopeptide (TPR) repeat protein
MNLAEKEVKDIQQAVYKLIQQSDFKSAYGLLHTLLEHDPNDGIALNFMGICHLENQNFPQAYQFFRRALQEKPNMAQVWTNFGLSAHELGRNKEAISSYLKSAELNNSYAKAYTNAAAVMIEEARWDEAESLCRMALEADPNDKNADMNLAHVYLARHDWANGWRHWEKSLGCKYRKEWIYGDEPRWDGSPGKNLVVYGEQGLGDEIFYASVIPDAIHVSNKVIIDCDPRLEALFRRSFPQAEVHGTRRDEHPAWLEDARIDARVAMSSLPSFYRNKDADFPGTSYLKADPDLVRMFKGMFEGKKVYGLCTHGGSKLTGAEYRKIEPEQFSPLFVLDAVFVSLDYKPLNHHSRIKELPWATQAKDYDLTAALIAACDAVIGVNTTAMHCANALGVPAHILIPEFHQWRYEGEYVWSKTARLHHKSKEEKWRDVVKKVRL